MAAEGMQSHDQSCGNCPTASHPANKKGRINAPILPKPARRAKSDRLLGPASVGKPGRTMSGKLCAGLYACPSNAMADWVTINAAMAIPANRFIGGLPGGGLP